MARRILIICAHPDDEVLGCAGTMARLVREKAQVYSLILGEGITSRYEKREDGAKCGELRKLKVCASKAAKIIGIRETFMFGFPDNRFDTVPLLDIVKVIEKIKKDIKPDAVYTHHKGDLNIDHRIIYDAVLAACRPLKGETVKEIYSFEILSSTEWNYPSTFQPNAYIDISGTIGKKIEAVKVYKSEIKEWPHPRSPQAIKILAQKRGCEAGIGYAEAFEIVRIFK